MIFSLSLQTHLKITYLHTIIMSSPFAYLQSVTRKARKAVAKADMAYAAMAATNPEFKARWPTPEDYSEHVWNQECSFVETDIYWMKKMKDRIGDSFKELICDDKPTSGYFITIRPDCTKSDFVDFQRKIEQFVARKCFIEGAYSFEQTGKTVAELGQGWHCHIVAKMKQRSKGEVLRDVLNSFKEWIDDGRIASNCIEVLLTKNPEVLVNNYLVEYVSDDGHKVATKDMDSLWRESINLKPLYGLSLSSPMGQLSST